MKIVIRKMGSTGWVIEVHIDEVAYGSGIFFMPLVQHPDAIPPGCFEAALKLVRRFDCVLEVQPPKETKP